MTFTLSDSKQRKYPLMARQEPQARKARKNLRERRPSVGEISLATPDLRHFATPKEAEAREKQKDMKKRTVISPMIILPRVWSHE